MTKKDNKDRSGGDLEGKTIAVVRVRGKTHVRSDIEDAMQLLGLKNVNNCTIVGYNKSTKGTLNKINNHVTWGEVDPGTLEKLLKGRARIEGGRPLTDDYLSGNTGFKTVKELAGKLCSSEAKLKDVPSLNKTFKLNPPVKGYDRKGIKKPYTLGGALGYRGTEMNKLLARMI